MLYLLWVKPYLDLVRQVLDHGEERDDRTGTGTISLFGAQTRYDLREGFPLVTTKKVLFPAVVRELLWFLRGATNINDDLTQHTPIWDAWADAHGELGPIYGYQWRNWRAADGGIDQIQRAIDDQARSRLAPDHRQRVERGDLPQMKLPPCHALFQFYVQGRWLDCQLYQRSADLALGVPFNIASYALLMSMIAQECGLAPRLLHPHARRRAHLSQPRRGREAAARARAAAAAAAARCRRARAPTHRFEDIALEGYQHHPFIKFAVAV